jgi:RNA recognition motif-containing protein
MANIYVGNCSFDVTEGELKDLFAAYGEVDKVSVITDRDTGRPRGFAFVEMSDSAAAQAAIQGVNGTDLGGRTLNVNEARPRGDGGGGGGRGGRGGGGGGGGGGRRW